MPEHVPVLLPAVLNGLHLEKNATVIDATLGGGGHARAMLDAIAPQGRLLGLEADPRTLTKTREALQSYGPRVTLIGGNFRDLAKLAAQHGFTGVDAILFDLGVSSMTLDEAERGFSFMADGPLDMRFDPSTQQLTAAQLIDQSTAAELEQILRDYGDERRAKRIAERLIDQRPFTTTKALAEAILAVKPRLGRAHPATQAFQALRIAVNDEYGAITAALPQALQLLKPGGRLAVISFHSGEDRLVKRWMKSLPAETATLLTKHVIVPTRDEQRNNPRSRSAKLRLLQRQ